MQVAASGEHKYNVWDCHFVYLSPIVYFSKFLAFCYFFIHMFKLNAVMNIN